MATCALIRWLREQPKEFVVEYFATDMLGDGQMTIDKLRELDDKYNNSPEDKEYVNRVE